MYDANDELGSMKSTKRAYHSRPSKVVSKMPNAAVNAAIAITRPTSASTLARTDAAPAIDLAIGRRIVSRRRRKP